MITHRQKGSQINSRRPQSMLSARALMFEENTSNSSSDRELFKLSTSPKHQHHVSIYLAHDHAPSIHPFSMDCLIARYSLYPAAAIATAAHTAIIPQRTFFGEHERRATTWQWQRPLQVLFGCVGLKGFQWFGYANPTSAQDLLSGASVPVKRKWLFIPFGVIKFGARTQLTAGQIGSIFITIFGMYQLSTQLKFTTFFLSRKNTSFSFPNPFAA